MKNCSEATRKPYSGQARNPKSLVRSTTTERPTRARFPRRDQPVRVFSFVKKKVLHLVNYRKNRMGEMGILRLLSPVLLAS